MKVIVEQRAGEDYPEKCKDNFKFYEGQKNSIRRRLQLRQNDVVEIREGLTFPVSREQIYNVTFSAIALDCKDASAVASTIVDRLLDHWKVITQA